MKVHSQRYILVIEAMKNSLLSTLDALVADYPEYDGVKLLLLSQNDEAKQYAGDRVVVETTDYSKESLAVFFEKDNMDIIAVLCRGDKYVQYLRKVVPYLQDTIPVASDVSLETTTNKRLMRQVFAHHSPEITPSYIKVNDAKASTIQQVSRSLTYPVIVKPASLASSLMIQRCNDDASLRQTLHDVFSSLKTIYETEGRNELPEVIVEEFLLGSFYSIDAYAMQKGAIFYTPIVEYLPAESMGINDFFLYKRWTPVDLSSQEENAAQVAVKKSIEAAGLEHSSVHAELIRTKDGWKIIEIGPRIGRFRNIMYKSAFGIDHGYNDLLIHLGLKPKLHTNVMNYVAAYSIYPTQEGMLKAVHGLDEVEHKIKKIEYMNVSNVTIGHDVRYARNGGHALAEIVFSCATLTEYIVTCQWFEKNVYAVVEGDR